MEIRCLHCKKKPSEIEEYVDCAKAENISAERYVVENEGTYNPSNGHFYCTSCYIKIGMPLGIAK